MSKFDKETKGEKFFEQRDDELNQLIDKSTGKIRADLVEEIDCLLCGGRKYDVLFTKNGFDFVRCLDCSHVYVNPAIKESAIVNQYNEDSKTNDFSFDFLSSEKHLEVRGKLFDGFFEKIKDKVPTGRVLDIGCSVGHFLKKAQDRGYETLGLELNGKAAQYAEEKNHVKVERKLLHECHFKDNSFDVISMWGVVEHLPHPVEVVSEIYRILRPGGAFIGICPNVQSLVCMVLHEMSRTFTGQLHLSYFSAKTLNQLFVKSGFESNKIDIDTCYTGKDSLINFFQFLDPFGDEKNDFLPEKFKNFISSEDNLKKLEDNMNELGVGLKLIFIVTK